ncbi:hypothetical protein [Bacillus paramobilis]|uniref:hypothetical protein n=1 Tax=Bacillus paramobilis TaxID=2817477 RepID=UPI001BB34D03|nr:hypothetical protein [Bacillus paramobilis]HEF5065754.1 hypothetical protein [Bacillus cereus]
MTNYHNVSVRLNEVDKKKLDSIQTELNKTFAKMEEKGISYANVLRFSLSWLHADMIANDGIDIDRNKEEEITLSKDKLDLLVHEKAMEMLKEFNLNNNNSTNTNTGTKANRGRNTNKNTNKEESKADNKTEKPADKVESK